MEDTPIFDLLEQDMGPFLSRTMAVRKAFYDFQDIDMNIIDMTEEN